MTISPRGERHPSSATRCWAAGRSARRCLPARRGGHRRRCDPPYTRPVTLPSPALRWSVRWSAPSRWPGCAASSKHFVGTQAGIELRRVTCDTMPARSMAASTPELPPPITAALALEQWAIAVRAVSHALVAVLIRRGTFICRQRAGGQDHRTGLEHRTVLQLHHQAVFAGRHQRAGTLQVRDVHVVLARTCCSSAADTASGLRFPFTEMKFSIIACCQHPPLPALGSDAGTGCPCARHRSLLRRQQRYLRPGTSKASLASSRHRLPVIESSLATICPGSCGPGRTPPLRPHGRHRHDLALFSRLSSWNSAPSMATC